MLLFLILVSVSSDQKRKFNRMRIYYGTLVNTVAGLIERAEVPSLEELKTYLQICYKELRPQLKYTESFTKVMFVIEVKHTIIDVDCLQAIVDFFNIEEAKDHITAYKVAIDEFCEEIRLDVCCNEVFKVKNSPYSHLKCETIEFVLEWEVEEHPLSDITALLKKAFQDMAKKVQVRYIKEGNSITVTCYAPRNIMGVLIMEAVKNLDLLRGIGLIKLSIGYHTVWDEHTRDKVRDD